MKKRKNIYFYCLFVMPVYAVITGGFWNSDSLGGFGLSGKSIPGILLSFIDWSIIMIGLIGIIAFIYAGYTYLTAGGKKDKIEQARKVVFYGIVGVAVSVLGLVAVTTVNNIMGGGENQIKGAREKEIERQNMIKECENLGGKWQEVEDAPDYCSCPGDDEAAGGIPENRYTLPISCESPLSTGLRHPCKIGQFYVSSLVSEGGKDKCYSKDEIKNNCTASKGEWKDLGDHQSSFGYNGEIELITETPSCKSWDTPFFREEYCETDSSGEEKCVKLAVTTQTCKCPSGYCLNDDAKCVLMGSKFVSPADYCKNSGGTLQKTANGKICQCPEGYGFSSHNSTCEQIPEPEE